MPSSSPLPNLPDRVRACLPLTLAALCLLGLGVALYAILPAASDWADCYRPSILNLAGGKSPYAAHLMQQCPVMNPPWVLAALIPLAILPSKVGGAVLFLATLACYALVAVKFNAKPAGVAALLLSYPVVYGLLYGQIDGLIAVGFLLPTPWALLLLLAKPQITIAAVAYLLIESYQAKGWAGVLKAVIPSAVAYAVSLAAFGNWLVWFAFPAGQSYNTSLFPPSLPIGLILLINAIRQRRFEHSVVASPFLSPYLAAHSWGVALLGLSPGTLPVVVASLSTWVIFLMGGGASNR